LSLRINAAICAPLPPSCGEKVRMRGSAEL
jgi:hypothetical protein